MARIQDYTFALIKFHIEYKTHTVTAATGTQVTRIVLQRSR